VISFMISSKNAFRRISVLGYYSLWNVTSIVTILRVSYVNNCLQRNLRSSLPPSILLIYLLAVVRYKKQPLLTVYTVKCNNTYTTQSRLHIPRQPFMKQSHTSTEVCSNPPSFLPVSEIPSFVIDGTKVMTDISIPHGFS